MSSAVVQEYDVVFAGGGTTAGVVAGRLAAADPTLRILILENGPHTQDDLAHIQVARFLTHLQPGSKTVKHVVGRPSEHLGGRALAVQCGQCVGGGSSVNFAMYTRPPASDYDDWARLYDNRGWGFADLLPLIQKAETYQVARDAPTHGYSGPLKASHGGARTNIGEDYLNTVSQYDETRVIVDDTNSMIDDVNRIGYWPKWIDQDTGSRSDVAHNYIYNTQKTSPNLVLHPGCAVRRVIVEGGRATGVEYVENPRVQVPGADPNTVYVARAKRLVVLSAGAFGSPAILERSGIGSKDVLARNGIEQLVDLPGVGENYNDHPLLFVPFYAKEGAETLNGIVRNDPVELEKWSAQWCKDKKGLMATNGIDAGMRYRPSEEEQRAMGPGLGDLWESSFANAPDKPFLYIGEISLYVGVTPPPTTLDCFTMEGFLEYPASTGSVHITSAHDVEAPPDFDTGVLRRKEDLIGMRQSYKLNREHARRMASYRGEYAPGHPQFRPGSAAALAPYPAEPVAIDAPDIVYTAEDDEAIDEMVKATVTTAWHSLGTCAMKPREGGGVVDCRLNVYGVEGLKVADLSICPSNVGSNTYSVAVAVGEKAAMIIGEEFGFKGV